MYLCYGNANIVTHYEDKAPERSSSNVVLVNNGSLIEKQKVEETDVKLTALKNRDWVMYVIKMNNSWSMK